MNVTYENDRFICKTTDQKLTLAIRDLVTCNVGFTINIIIVTYANFKFRNKSIFIIILIFLNLSILSIGNLFLIHILFLIIYIIIGSFYLMNSQDIVNYMYLILIISLAVLKFALNLNIIRLVYLVLVPLSFLITFNIYGEVVTEEIVVNMLDIQNKSYRNLIN